MYSSRITGTGHYVPETIVTNNDLAQMLPTTNEWILERTGIKERRFFKEGVDTVSTMAVEASKRALLKAGLVANQIEMIICASITTEYQFPGSAVLMQRQLGLPGIPALDIRMQCSGFIYALSIADQYIRSGTYKAILVVGSEVQSNILEMSERGRNMAVIFGDGAGAVILQAEKDSNHGILSTHLHADGTFAEELMLKNPGTLLKNRLTHQMLEDGSMLPYMNGPVVFKHAVVRFIEVIEEALSFNKLTKNDIQLLIPHQANLRISEYIREKLGLSESIVYNNIQRYGNTTAASIPIALSEAFEEGKVKKNDIICLAAFGSGFTWASALIRW